MARIPRMLVTHEDAIYHVISRTALDGFVLGGVEKDYLFDLIKRLSTIYFTEVFGYCIMGNHFHLLVKMKTADDYSDNEVKRRIGLSFRHFESLKLAKFPIRQEFFQQIIHRF